MMEVLDYASVSINGVGLVYCAMRVMRFTHLYGMEKGNYPSYSVECPVSIGTLYEEDIQKDQGDRHHRPSLR